MKTPGFSLRIDHAAGVGGRGFYVTFDNGYSVSTQFGEFNYCDKEGSDAEIAIFDPKGNFVRLPGWDDDVKGYQNPQNFLDICNQVARMQP
jgi:hypothetical protein